MAEDPSARLRDTLTLNERDLDWILEGICPKCQHPISKSIPKIGELGLTVRTRSDEDPAETSTVLRCNCGQHEGGGCGFFARVRLG